MKIAVAIITLFVKERKSKQHSIQNLIITTCEQNIGYQRMCDF